MTTKLPKAKKTITKTTTKPKTNGTGGASAPKSTTQKTTGTGGASPSSGGSSKSTKTTTAKAASKKSSTSKPATRQKQPAASPNVVVSGFSGDNTPSKTAIDATLPKSNSASTAGCNTRGCIVRLVEKQLGVVESPAGSNKVPRGYNINDAWCASFATYMWKKAGINIPQYINGDQIKSWAEGRKLWHAKGSGYKMHSGDIIIFDGPANGYPRSQHTAIVDRVYRDGTIEVIGGNVRNSKTGNDGVYFQGSINGKKRDYPSNFRGGGYSIWGYVESPYRR